MPEPELHADVGHVEGNYQSYIEDLKRWKGPDAERLERLREYHRT